MGWVLGVDFGTSNTAAAHTGAVMGAVAPLALSHHGNLMPSSVFVSGSSIVVGEVALNQASTNPAAFVPAPKRVVGQGVANVNYVDVRASDLVAAVLRVVLERGVAQHGGEPPESMVLTHPEAWSPAELQVLAEAAQRAGMDPARTRLVSEPRAAAHFYTRSQSDPLAPGDKIAVYDYGGGTLDVAVLAATASGGFEVIAARGDNARGGKNLDALLRRWVDQQLAERNPDLQQFLLRAAPMDVLRNLDDSIRQAKELLSEAPQATITIKAHGHSESFLLPRDELEHAISGEIDAGAALTRSTFADAGVGGNDLRALYLTGGSSRIPLVHQRLNTIGPVATLDDPKTVVAQGGLIASEAFVAGEQNAPTPWAAPIPPSAPPSAPTVGSRGPAESTAAVPDWRGRARIALFVITTIVLIAAAGVAVYIRNEHRTNAQSATQAPPRTDPVAEVTAKLPDQLRKDSHCEKQDYDQNQKLELSCTVNPDSDLGRSLHASDDQPVMYSVTVDLGMARQLLAQWKDDADPEKQLVLNQPQTAGVQINSASSNNQPGKTSFMFANRDTGLYIDWPGFPGGVTDVQNFVHKNGLA